MFTLTAFKDLRINHSDGRYDDMLEPVDKDGKAFIFEFKVLDPDENEETLEDTLAAAHRQITEKNMRQSLYHTNLHFGEGNV